ncbi:putative porin [Flavobacteriales bacterium]|nr:putative porin [Flavobacteriales bacterium]MDB4088723.1 putative porin [Flavobacteriales bacterium]
MKKLITALLFIISFCGQSQIVDSNYTNLYSHVSDYRNYNEVYLSNLGQAKFNLFSPFEDNNPLVSNLFNTPSKSSTYTDVFYVLGSGKENYFNLQHQQNLGKNLIGNVSFLKTNSLGIYSTNSATLSNFSLALKFIPKDKRYNFAIDFNNYKRNNDINGGVADSSFFSLLDSSNANVKTTFPIQMVSAVPTSPNSLEVKVLDVNYKHSFSFSKERNDSLGYFQLSQSLGYKRTKQSFYVLINNGFFSDYHYDSVTTLDSMKLEQVTHKIGVDYIKNNTILSAGIGQNYFEYLSYSPFKVHFENLIYGSFYTKKNKLELKSEANIIASNGKYESFNFNSKLIYIDSALTIFNAFKANLNLGTNQPELYYDNYVSNHYQWNRVNNRNSIVKADITAFNLLNKTSVTLNFESQSNSIYWDTASQIGQTGVSVYGITLKKEFRFTKNFFLLSSVRFQDVTASKTIEIPNFVTFNKIYFKGKMFKKQLAFDAGINVLYYTSFYAKAYNPALDKFFVQDKQKVGNYPILDIFAEFYLKNNFSFFITATHVNSGLLKKELGRNYLAATSYPLQDRSFKFGLKWRLLN